MRSFSKVDWEQERKREEFMVTPRFSLRTWVVDAPSAEKAKIPDNVRHD